MPVTPFKPIRHDGAARHPITADDAWRWWACCVVAPHGAEIAYLPDRARIFGADGTVTDVIGGQSFANWPVLLKE